MGGVKGLLIRILIDGLVSLWSEIIWVIVNRMTRQILRQCSILYGNIEFSPSVKTWPHSGSATLLIL